MGRTSKDGDVLLLGSLPFDDAASTFKRMGEGLGDHLFAIPDGEFGERKMWVGYALSLFRANPAIEVVVGEADPEYKGYGTPPIQFRVIDPDQLAFETAGYAQFALDSYADFKKARDSGSIADGVRFQVTFPGVGSQIEYFFVEESWPVMTKAYREAVRRDIERISELVPPEDLLVQFDLCYELMDLATGERNTFVAWPERTFEEKVAHHLAQLKELPSFVPEGALLGLHLCYGTWGGWPMVDMQDLAVCVRVANEATAASPREFDYIHMPTTPEADESFFAPLAHLEIGHARLILGIVHFHDGKGEFERRFEAASEYSQNFGVASVCGFGRVPADELDSVIEAHTTAAEALDRIA